MKGTPLTARKDFMKEVTFELDLKGEQRVFRLKERHCKHREQHVCKKYEVISLEDGDISGKAPSDALGA